MRFARARFVLDTDIVTAHQADNAALLARLATLAPDEAATTVVTMYEQLRGRLARVNASMGDSAALQTAYLQLQETYDYYSRIPVLPFDAAAVVAHRDLARRRIRGGPGAQDLQIAAIALAQGATLVTRNQRHFREIPGLTIDDWAE